MAIFITGTDTNVGKTIIGAWLCLQMNASYWKPIQSGYIDGTDSDFLHVCGIYVYPEIYKFQNPLSPHVAAAMENIIIDPKNIHLPHNNKLIVEGAGGVLVPLTKNYLLIDLIESLNLPVIIVARSTLGTINHTCLTLEALRKRKIPVVGVIMNGPYNELNNNAVEEYGNTNILASFPLLKSVDYQSLKSIPLSLQFKQILEPHL